MSMPERGQYVLSLHLLLAKRDAIFREIICRLKQHLKSHHRTVMSLRSWAWRFPNKILKDSKRWKANHMCELNFNCGRNMMSRVRVTWNYSVIGELFGKRIKAWDGSVPSCLKDEIWGFNSRSGHNNVNSRNNRCVAAGTVPHPFNAATPTEYTLCTPPSCGRNLTSYSPIRSTFKAEAKKREAHNKHLRELGPPSSLWVYGPYVAPYVTAHIRLLIRF